MLVLVSFLCAYNVVMKMLINLVEKFLPPIAIALKRVRKKNNKWFHFCLHYKCFNHFYKHLRSIYNCVSMLMHLPTCQLPLIYYYFCWYLKTVKYLNLKGVVYLLFICTEFLAIVSSEPLQKQEETLQFCRRITRKQPWMVCNLSHTLTIYFVVMLDCFGSG